MKDLIKNKDKYLNRVNELKEVIPKQDVLSLFSKLSDVRREMAVTEREVARISAARDIALSEIQSKYALYHKVFDRVFEERRDAINKNFEIIDKGLAANDRDLILGGLKGLSDIVASSPFGSIEQLGRALESNQRIEI
jgi:hypothetical protein